VIPLLQTRALAKVFGGLHAVRPVDFRLDPGEVRAIIGPNGAGKTTLASMISGRIAPTSGAVFFKGRDISGLKAWDRVALGIVCTFQLTSIFRRLTVSDNVTLAAQTRFMRLALDRIVISRRGLTEHVGATLMHVGLADVSDRQAGSLSYGHQRLVEVAMALALEPELLILDEPTQGLAPEEITAFCELIRGISNRISLVLIEHNIAVVLELATKVTVMDGGAIVAEGPPAEIETDPGVQRVYLGL